MRRIAINIRSLRRSCSIAPVIFASTLVLASSASANQREEQLSYAVATSLQKQIGAPFGSLSFRARMDSSEWVAQALGMVKNLPSEERRPFLELVHYEATRAALDPWLVLALIKVESGFKRYATSPVGAQGYMQIMPFWRKYIGTNNQSLFDPATNVRYGCTILRHYIQIERGNVVRALARYNGSLGRTTYPDLIFAVWKAYRPDTFMAFRR